VHSLRNELEGRRLEISHDDKIPATAFDRRLLRLAVKQLIDNAAKYSPAGTPLEIQIRNSGNTIYVEVTDHGKGIPEREQARVFERFFRSPSIRHRIPGSGLGLSIAYSILHAHHGELTVTSQPGKTTFRLILPMEVKGESIERRPNSSN
jgi:signal transduction histidine kinase